MKLLEKTRKINKLLQKGDKVVIAGGAKVVTDLSDAEADINTVMGGIVQI